MYDIDARMIAWDKANHAESTDEAISFIKSNGDDVGGNMNNGSISTPVGENAPAEAVGKKENPLVAGLKKIRSKFTRSCPYDFAARTSAWNQAGLSSEETSRILKSTSATEKFKRNADIAAAVDSMSDEELEVKFMEAMEELMSRMGA